MFGGKDKLDFVKDAPSFLRFERLIKSHRSVSVEISLHEGDTGCLREMRVNQILDD